MQPAKDQQRILVVDDDDSVRAALTRFLQKTGYEAVPANGGAAAIEILSHGKFAAMLCDIRMPGMTGVELLPKVMELDADLAVIMLTAVGDPSSAIQCLKLGAFDYLIKPVELEELAHALRMGLRKRELEVERRGMEQWLAREVAEKTKELSEQSRQVELLSLSMLMALVDAAEPHGQGGRNHSMRVANMSAHVAVEMGLASEAVEMVRLAGRIHDLGRVALRDEGLRRISSADRRGDDASSVEQDASLVAARILEPLKRHAEIASYIKYQHEHWDGSGRPEGRGGDLIPVGSRVIAATNLYDELSEGLNGGAPLPQVEAIGKLRSASGTILDPAAVTAIETVVARRRH